jgi:hypothetical protein
MESNTLTESQYKTFFAFHAKFYWLEFVVVWGFWERRFFLITSYEFPITFAHQEIHNPKFPHLEIVLV